MKVTRFAAAVFTLFAINAQAQVLDSLMIECPVTRLPTQADVARVFAVDNFAKTYAMRSRVYTFARQQCAGGIDRVQIVSGPARTPVLESTFAAVR
ncbi:MAG: hypothetical protein ABI650_09810 [Dokdonella sp.]